MATVVDLNGTFDKSCIDLLERLKLIPHIKTSSMDWALKQLVGKRIYYRTWAQTIMLRGGAVIENVDIFWKDSWLLPSRVRLHVTPSASVQYLQLDSDRKHWWAYGRRSWFFGRRPRHLVILELID